MPLTKITGGEFDNTQGGLSVAGIITASSDLLVSGNLGIGTANPTSKLHVYNGNITLENLASTATDGPYIDFRETGFADRFGVFADFGGVGDDNKLHLTANSSGSVPQTSDAKVTLLPSGSFLIGATSATGTASQPLQVTGGAYVSGNLGIGTINPSAALHITSPTLQAYFEGSTQGSITLRKTGTTGFNIYTPSSGGLGFYDNVASATRVTIDSSGNFQFNSGYGSAATAYGCRAWVNFNGTTASPSTIRGSGNVTSVTKTGTGDYTVNFTTAMVDVNYCAVGQSGYTSNGFGAGSVAFNRIGNTGNESAPATGSIRVNAIASNGDASADQIYIYVAIFR